MYVSVAWTREKIYKVKNNKTIDVFQNLDKLYKFDTSRKN